MSSLQGCLTSYICLMPSFLMWLSYLLYDCLMPSLLLWLTSYLPIAAYLGLPDTSRMTLLPRGCLMSSLLGWLSDIWLPCAQSSQMPHFLWLPDAQPSRMTLLPMTAWCQVFKDDSPPYDCLMFLGWLPTYGCLMLVVWRPYCGSLTLSLLE